MSSNDLEELRRELQTALGTAKWQLDEFEKAVRSSYGNWRDQNNMARHQQFIVAIESQISRAEDAPRESQNEDGKQPFRWVNLNEDERDDLTMFLSGFSGTRTKSTQDDAIKFSLPKTQDVDYAPCSSSYSAGLSPSKDEIVIDIELPDCVMGMRAKEAPTARVNDSSEADRTRSSKRMHGLSKFGSLGISIPDEDDQTRNLMQETVDTPKERGSRLSNLIYFPSN